MGIKRKEWFFLFIMYFLLLDLLKCSKTFTVFFYFIPQLKAILKLRQGSQSKKG